MTAGAGGVVIDSDGTTTNYRNHAHHGWHRRAAYPDDCSGCRWEARYDEGVTR